MCPDDWNEAILHDPGNMFEKGCLQDVVQKLQLELARNYLKKGRL